MATNLVSQKGFPGENLFQKVLEFIKQTPPEEVWKQYVSDLNRRIGHFHVLMGGLLQYKYKAKDPDELIEQYKYLQSVKVALNSAMQEIQKAYPKMPEMSYAFFPLFTSTLALIEHRSPQIDFYARGKRRGRDRQFEIDAKATQKLVQDCGDGLAMLANMADDFASSLQGRLTEGIPKEQQQNYQPDLKNLYTAIGGWIKRLQIKPGIPLSLDDMDAMLEEVEKMMGDLAFRYNGSPAMMNNILPLMRKIYTKLMDAITRDDNFSPLAGMFGELARAVQKEMI